MTLDPSRRYGHRPGLLEVEERLGVDLGDRRGLRSVADPPQGRRRRLGSIEDALRTPREQRSAELRDIEPDQVVTRSQPRAHRARREHRSRWCASAPRPVRLDARDVDHRASTRPASVDWGDQQIRLTDSVSCLVGTDNGLYPSGNSVLIEGRSEAALIDPSVTVVAKGGARAGRRRRSTPTATKTTSPATGLFPDRQGPRAPRRPCRRRQSSTACSTCTGFEGETRTDSGRQIVEEFTSHRGPTPKGSPTAMSSTSAAASRSRPCTCPVTPRATAGSASTAVSSSSPTSTLTGFGPYYGDAWSTSSSSTTASPGSRSRADWYVTFHHKGIIEGRQTFLTMIDGFQAVIERRHQAMLDFLVDPHSTEEMAIQRFVYRPHVEGLFIGAVEKRTAELHVARMLLRGEVTESEPGRFQRS